jgi:hypothetical protein
VQQSQWCQTTGRYGGLVWRTMVYAAALIAMCSSLLDAQPGGRRKDSTVIVKNNPDVTAESFRRDSIRRAEAAHRLADVSRQLGHMYFLIPEYHDEQQFQTGANDFGPMAYLSASPFIGSFTTVAQIKEQGTYGTFAAIVKVDTTDGATLPEPYHSLELRGGENCVWLANPTGDITNGWLGYVTPLTPGQGCVRPSGGASAPTQLKVYRSTPAGFTFFDYPPVARFGEASPLNGASFNQPLLGVKCLAGWCEIGPNAPVVPLPPETAGNGKEGRIKGYHDVQTLAYKDDAGVLRSAGRAVLEPVPGLDRMSKDGFAVSNGADAGAGWVLVARILFAADPPTNTKYFKWGLRRGANHLFLRRTGPDRWEMSTRNPLHRIRYIWQNVRREPHTDIHVPGTARWRFADFDPMGVWVRCGEACCSGDGGLGGT